MEKKGNGFEAVLGTAVLAGLATGFAGLLAAACAIFGGEWVAVGVCLGAAALAFGLIANAVLRH